MLFTMRSSFQEKDLCCLSLSSFRRRRGLLTDGDVAFFFNEFERPIRVTIIQIGKPGFYETVRMVQPLQLQLSPRMKLKEIESHRLFTAEMWPSYTDNLSEERELEPTLKSLIKWGPKIDWDFPFDKGQDTDRD